jgi:hypothetical protein
MTATHAHASGVITGDASYSSPSRELVAALLPSQHTSPLIHKWLHAGPLRVGETFDLALPRGA